MPEPRATAQTIAERIEDLYARPLADLEALAATHPDASMLAALITGLTDLQFAERNIAFQRQRLLQLADPEREIGSFAAGHIRDCARRLCESVATRDAHAKTLSGVLASLHRVPAPDPKPEPTVSAAPVPAPARATAPTR